MEANAKKTPACADRFTRIHVTGAAAGHAPGRRASCAAEAEPAADQLKRRRRDPATVASRRACDSRPARCWRRCSVRTLALRGSSARPAAPRAPSAPAQGFRAADRQCPRSSGTSADTRSRAWSFTVRASGRRALASDGMRHSPTTCRPDSDRQPLRLHRRPGSGLEPVAHARSPLGGSGGGRVPLPACGGAGLRRRAGSSTRSRRPGPIRPGVSLLLGDQAAAVADQASPGAAILVGVSRTSAPSLMTLFAARSTVKSGGGDDGLVGAGRRGGPPRGAGRASRPSERLGHVVVGAGVERGYLLVLGAPYRQHHDRGPGTSRGIPRMTSVPSMSGSPRSRMTASGRSRETAARPEAPSFRGGHLVVARGQVDAQRPEDRRLVDR